MLRGPARKAVAALTVLATLSLLVPRQASAAFLTLSLLDQPLTDALVKTFGLLLDHRAYEPATPLAMNSGVVISMETTVAQLPSDLNTALQNDGFGTIPLPFFPVLKFHLRKPMNDRVDIGLSGIYLPSQATGGMGSIQNIGGDLKLVVFMQEEGPTVAIRAGYSNNQFAFNTTVPGPFGTSSNGTLHLSTGTFSVQVLTSRQMDFADPYGGVGAQYAVGGASLDTGSALVAVNPSNGSGYALSGFVGVKFHFIGIKLALEGGYSTTLALFPQNSGDYLGVNLGFNF